MCYSSTSGARKLTHRQQAHQSTFLPYRIQSELCPVHALTCYLAVRLQRYPEGTLFILSDGKALSPSQFNHFIKAAVRNVGLDPANYSSHSLRAGAATTAAAAGLPEWLIKSMGRWSSDAYLRYIRTPPAALANLANVLCHTKL